MLWILQYWLHLYITLASFFCMGIYLNYFCKHIPDLEWEQFHPSEIHLINNSHALDANFFSFETFHLLAYIWYKGHKLPVILSKIKNLSTQLSNQCSSRYHICTQYTLYYFLYWVYHYVWLIILYTSIFVVNCIHKRIKEVLVILPSSLGVTHEWLESTHSCLGLASTSAQSSSTIQPHSNQWYSEYM